MSRFDRNRSGGKPRFGGRPSFGARSSDPREMFKATCGNCGANCEVPFRPTGERPVLCSNCFEQAGGRGPRDSRDSRGPRDSHRSDSRRFDRPPRMERPQRNEEYEQLNAKLDKILKLLQKMKPQNEEMSLEDLVAKPDDDNNE